MYGAATFAWYLASLIFQHTTIAGIRAVVVAITICMTVIVVSFSLDNTL
jgi:hypothetical protein